MRILRAGAIVLSIWCVLEALVAVWVTIATLAGQPPPALALMMSDARISTADRDVIAVVNAQALIANPLIVAIVIALLAVTWKALIAGQRWAYWTLVAILIPVQSFGFVSDGAIGGHYLAANVISSLIVVVALALAGIGLRRLGRRAARDHDAPLGRPARRLPRRHSRVRRQGSHRHRLRMPRL
ncbi:hypothetical protein BH09MYX1_BH09MYX1_30120 [soil metagenome]